MRKQKISKKTIFGLVWLIILVRKVGFLWIYGGSIYWQEWLALGWLVMAFVIGAISLLADRILDIYVVNPDSKLAIFCKRYIEQGKKMEAMMILLKNKNLQKRLYMHSALFQIAWVGLAILAVMSSSSYFGKGYVMGLGLWLLLTQWEEYLIDKKDFRDRFFWQINAKISTRDLKIYLIAMSLTWLWLMMKVI